MRRDLLTSLIAVVLMTLVFGLAYPLAFTGVAQVLFPGKADGSRITEDGKLVGSSLIAQDFRKIVPSGREHGPKLTRVPDRRYFQPRPSQTNYDPSVTYFSNLGPNSKDARDEVKANLADYLTLERRYDPGLTAVGRADRRGDPVGVRGRPPHLRGQRPDPGAPDRRRPPPAALASRGPDRRPHRRPLPRPVRRARRERARAQPRPRRGGPGRHDREPAPLPLRSRARGPGAARVADASSTRACSSATRSCSWSRSAP